MQGDDDKSAVPEEDRPTDPSHPSQPASHNDEDRPATQVERAHRKRKRDDADKPDEHVGKIFGGKYRIDRLVAKGGMGRVYRAIQFPLERPVAIKILNSEFQRTDPQFVRRFFLEASTAAKLAHPHTITVFDYGEAESGELYIAMEYLKGRPLSKLIQNEGPFPADRALKIGVQICRALREAHALGIIHRDLKPGNVFMLEEGDEGDYAKVLDFGLVKLFRPDDAKKEQAGMLGEGDPELTRTGTLLGSPKYMSPEQIQGHSLDPRTDIYSFGIILFQMMAGKAPFTGATGVDVIYKHVHQPTPAIAEISPEVECPAPVEAIVQRCLKKKREERYASMDEVLIALKEAARMVGGKIVSVDSVAEVSSSLAGAAKKLTPQPESTQEARFAPVLEEATPTGQVADRSGRVTPRAKSSSSVALLVSALGFMLALATLAFVMLSGKKKPEEDARPAIAQPQLPVRVDREVAISSTPLGAEVFDGEKNLGTTPFKHTFSVPREGQESLELVFHLDGFKQTTRTIVLDTHVSELSATLEASPPSVEVAEEQDDASGDHKSGGSRKKKTAASHSSKQHEKDGDKDSTPYRQNPY